MKISKVAEALIKTSFLMIALPFGPLAPLAFAANDSQNGIIIDGINFALAGTLTFDSGESIPVTYTDPFNQNQTQQSTWMLNCSSSMYQSCTSPFTQELQKNLGDNITYLLLDFPSIDTDIDPTQITPSTLNTCPITDGVPSKFSPQAFNYVAPFITNSPDLGPINACIDGKKITQAFAAAGHKVIPMISGSGSDLSALNLKDPTYLSTLAGLIATEINGDASVSGVAFDIEPNIKGQSDNQAFFGTLAAALKSSQKVILIYNGDWSSLKQLSETSNIIAMGAMYDFGLEDSPTENHWFQDISPTSYGIQFSKELTAFINGDASTFHKMIVVPSAASDTLWTGLNILNNNEPDKTGGDGKTPASYDPYLVQRFNSSTSYGDPDAQPSEYQNSNPSLLLKAADAIACPTTENNENCYSNPYDDAKINGQIDQNAYIKLALSSPETVSMMKNGTLEGIIFYNIKPDNFYELNCANASQASSLCMSFDPESTPASVIQDFNAFSKSLTSGKS